MRRCERCGGVIVRWQTLDGPEVACMACGRPADPARPVLRCWRCGRERESRQVRRVLDSFQCIAHAACARHERRLLAERVNYKETVSPEVRG